MKTVLEVKGLEKSYGKFKVVKGISFSVKEGEIFGLLGPNGAGKSTTINMITGVLAKDSGSIKILGKTLEEDWEFDGIDITLSSPYNHSYKIGPYVHAMWKKSSDNGWHRFRPRKISERNGTQTLVPSSSYKDIDTSEDVIIRIEINYLI